MAIPDPATTEWVPLYNKNAIQGPQGPTGPTGPTGPAGASADLDYVGDYVPATYNDGDIVYADDGIAYICIKNGVTTPPEPWPGTSGVTLVPHATTHNTAGNDAITSISGGIITSGTVADARLSTNIPLKNVTNVFSQDQQIVKGAPTLAFEDTSQVVDAKKWRIYSSGQNLNFQSVNDAVTVEQGLFNIKRNGSIYTYGTITERARTTPMGEWIAYTPVWKEYNGTPVAIGNGTLTGKYTIIGKTVFFSIQMVTGSTTAIGSGYWTWTLPPLAYTGYYGLGGTAWIVEGGTGAPFVAQITSGAFFLGIANSITLLVHKTGVSSAAIVGLNNPMTFPSGSSLWIDGRYEMA